jgi:glycosyltransferase involved in cell wall biosynthesis
MIRDMCAHPLMVEPPVPPNITIFSHVGRLVKKKNHQLLIETAVRLKKKYPHFVILCAGDGPERAKIKQKIQESGLEENIIMLGETDNPFAIMAKSRALIHTSYHESFAIVLVEAMASGTTVIAVDCPYGPSEILDKGKYGMLVPMNDPQALADSMFKMANDDSVFEEFKRRGKQRALDFDVHAIIKKWEKLLIDYS